jgi:hypothetical protein
VERSGAVSGPIGIAVIAMRPRPVTETAMMYQDFRVRV